MPEVPSAASSLFTWMNALLEVSARPFYDFLGTQEPDKRHFIAQGGHLIPQVDATRETLDWFDRYLGEVR